MAPTMAASPEVFLVKNKMHATGCDLFLDVHGDESLPYNFVAGSEMLEGFTRSSTSRRLVVVGSANYSDAFHMRLKALADADARILLVGHVHDQAALTELWCNCFAYLHGHSVGGTNPALLRAMGCSCAVLALDTVFNREVLGDTGAYFSRSSTAVTEVIQLLDAGDRVGQMRVDARARVRERYTWEGVTSQYEDLFLQVARVSRAG